MTHARSGSTRAWATFAAAALLTTSFIVAIEEPATAAAAPLPQGVLVGDAATPITAAALTDLAVYAQTTAGIVTHLRDDSAAGWSAVEFDGVQLTGDLLAADSDVLLLDGGAQDTLAWRATDGTWSARTVADGTELGRGGAYVLLPGLAATDGSRVAWPIQDSRTGDLALTYSAPAGKAISIDGTSLWALETSPSRQIQLDIVSHATLSETPTGSDVTRIAPNGRWAAITPMGFPGPFVRDLSGAYVSWSAWSTMDRVAPLLGRDVAVGLLTPAQTLVVTELAGSRHTTSYGPAAPARPDVDERGATVVYVDLEGHARLVDTRAAPIASTTVQDHAAPDVPVAWVDRAVSSAASIRGGADGTADNATWPFRSSGWAGTELRYRQVRAGAAAGSWSAPAVGPSIVVRAVDATTTCIAARSTDVAGNASAWSQPACTRSDLSGPVLTRITVPTAAITTNGRAPATVTYAATDGAGVSSYDVRYRIKARGGDAYGPWVYRASLQGTTATRASVTIASRERICFSVRARDGFGTASAWSSDRCLGTDDARPKVTKVSVPRWHGVPAHGTVRSTVKFAATDDRGVASYDVRVRVAAITDGFGPWTSLASRTQHTSVSHTLRAGDEACYEVRARDTAGRVSGWSGPHCTDVAARASAKAFGADRVGSVGGERVAVLRDGARRAGARSGVALFQQRSAGIRLQVRTCPTCGTFNVQMDETITHVSTRSSKPGWKYVTIYWRDPAYGGYVFFDEEIPYPHPRITTSYIGSWVLIRHV